MAQLRFFDPKQPQEQIKLNAKKALALEVNRQNQALNRQQMITSEQTKKQKARTSFARKRLYRQRKLRAHKRQALHNFLLLVPQILNSEHHWIGSKLLKHCHFFTKPHPTKKTDKPEGSMPDTGNEFLDGRFPYSPVF